MWRNGAWNSLPGFQLSQRKGVPGTPKGQYNQKHNGNSEVANASKSHLHVSHANICLDVLLKRCSVPHQLQLKIITLFLGQMKGLHQQPHGLVTSPAQKMQGFFPWNHVLLLFPSFIHSFGFATRLQTSTETNYPLALATCRTHFHLGKTKKQQVQLEGIIISDDKASSSISNSAVLSQHLRSGKYASRCLLRGHRWSLLIICFWTQLNIFYTNPRVREIIPGRAREIPNTFRSWIILENDTTFQAHHCIFRWILVNPSQDLSKYLLFTHLFA